MVKKILVLVVVLFTLSNVCGCGKHDEVVVKLEGNKTVGLWIDQVLRVELDANATTGYAWSLTGDLDKGIIKQASKYKYIRKADAIGAGGIQVYRFRALKQGKAALTFEYKRAWEKDAVAAKKYKVTVIVH